MSLIITQVNVLDTTFINRFSKDPGSIYKENDTFYTTVSLKLIAQSREEIDLFVQNLITNDPNKTTA